MFRSAHALLACSLALACATPALAQLKPPDQVIREMNAGNQKPLSPFVPAGGIKTPDQLIKNLQALSLADFQYALARAKSANNTITQPCWQAWVDLLTKAQAPMVGPDGKALEKPADGHLFSDLEDASELIQALQVGGPIQTGCAALADAAKKSVTQAVSGILSGGALGGLLPISPLLPLPIP